MIKLLKRCNIYAPKPMGIMDILLADEKICLMEKNLSEWEHVKNVEVYDLKGLTVCPGLIDSHVHVTGGGGEQGPSSRTPELKLTDFTMNGITSVLGLLGTDGISRSLENLLFKCMALEEEGLSAWTLTGNYRLPSKTLTGDVQKDIALIDKMVGVKLAISDHRGSAVTGQELARLGSEARIGGMMSGKAGIVVLHMGDDPRGMKELFWVMENTPIPAKTFIPTHCCRAPHVVRDAVKFNQMGGTIDFTADISEDINAGGTAKVMMEAMKMGADPERMTMTSDAGGSQPVFNDAGECIGLEVGTGKTLLLELKRLVRKFNLPMETALGFLTVNPARVLGQTGRKGVLMPGADADILALDEEFKVRHLFMKGKKAVFNGQPVMKGKFER